MYIHSFDWNSFKKCLNENSIVILGVASKDLVLKNFFKSSLLKLKKLVDNKWIIGIMEQDVFEEKVKISKVLPMVLVYHNNKLIKEIYGFKDYKRLYSEIDLEKVA